MVIVAGLRPLFQASELGTLETLLNAPVGEPIGQQTPEREVRRLTLANGQMTFCGYLKRVKQEPWHLLLRMLLFGHRPRSGPLREQLLLQRLHEAGFAVMEPVAWGERCSCGLPRAGFLVAREVPGTDVATLFSTLPDLPRRLLLTEVGRLIGRLHSEGFFQPVRLKDLIRTKAGNSDSDLVLIDRETSKPWRARFTKRRCLTALARSWRRTVREGHSWSAGSTRAFFKGYVMALKSRCNMTPGAWSRAVIQALRRSG